MAWRQARLAAAVMAAVALTACGDSKQPPAGAGGGAPAMPPAQVGVVTVQLRDVGLQTELPGRLEASRVAEVRARAAGILQKRLFREGSDVKAGQQLFTIDSAPYEASLNNAKAQLAQAEAVLLQAKSLADRYRPLVAENAVSEQDYANAVAAQKQAEAQVQAGKAAVRTASITAGYTNVTAPISGRIGRALVTEGALVGQGEPTALAVIQQINPLYVNFTQSASEALKLRRAMQSGQFKPAAGGDGVSVRILLDDGTEYSEAGKLLFSDLTVDSATGQVTLRAEVPNPRGELLPGLYVRVQLEQAQVNSAVLIPQQAVTRSEQGDVVMVVDAEGKVAPRPVQISGQQQGSWVVTGGLKDGEQVMVDGFMKLRGGAPVKAVPWTPPGAKPSQEGGAAPAAEKPADKPAESTSGGQG